MPLVEQFAFPLQRDFLVGQVGQLYVGGKSKECGQYLNPLFFCMSSGLTRTDESYLNAYFLRALKCKFPLWSINGKRKPLKNERFILALVAMFFFCSNISASDESSFQR